MGGRGSGRWREHRKASLVENAIDISTLRRAGLLEGPSKRATTSWTHGESPVATGWIELEISEGGTKHLNVSISLQFVEDRCDRHSGQQDNSRRFYR